MGDISKEPSMEEILSSIKRIIAEDSEDSVAPEQKARVRKDADKESRRKAIVASMAADPLEDGHSYVDEVLELTDEMPRVGKTGEQEQDMAQIPAELRSQRERTIETVRAQAEAIASPDQPLGDESIVSVESELAARSSLAALSSMILASAEPGNNTLEGLVREMLRPMLKEWLDAHLPTLVEGMVAKEIARITGRPL